MIIIYSSDMFMVAKDFPSFLGGIERDPEGRIIKAEATIMYFFSKMNVTEAHLEQVQEDSILGDQVGVLKKKVFKYTALHL